MKVKIKIGAYASGNNPELTKFLNENAGKFVKVETDYLFNDQYNTAKFRLFDSQISEVQNDERINKGKCKYCGKMHAKNEQDTPQICTEHKECKDYKIEWFTPDNTYFLKYPKGYTDTPILPEQMIGSYHLENTKYGYYVLRNNRKTFRFTYNPNEKKRFIIFDTIGTKQTRYLDIPEQAMSKLIKVLNEANKK